MARARKYVVTTGGSLQTFSAPKVTKPPPRKEEKRVPLPTSLKPPPEKKSTAEKIIEAPEKYTPKQKLAALGFAGAKAVSDVSAQLRMPPTVSARPSVRPTPAQRATPRFNPAFPGEKISGYVSVPVSRAYPTGMRPIYTKKPGPIGDVETGWSSADVAQAARVRLQQLGLPGEIFRETATSLVPHALADIAQGRPVRGGEVAKDAVNLALNLLGTPFSPAALAAAVPLRLMGRAASEANMAWRAAEGGSAVAREAAAARAVEGVTGPLVDRQTVRAAKRSAALQSVQRNAAYRAIEDLADDPKIAAMMKDQIDAHIYNTVSKQPVKERKAAAEALYEGISKTINEAPEHPVLGFRPVVDDVKGQANLRVAQKAREQFAKTGKAGVTNQATHSAHPDLEGVQITGEITPEEWARRTTIAVGGNAQLGLKLANWYREAMPILRTFFGDDADQIMRGFAVSQANASPAGGMTAVLHLRDKLLRGDKIGAKEASTVKDSIIMALEGQPISKGMAAKLHDFAASLEGTKARSWTAADIRGGAPVAVDVHALRDIGYLDQKLLKTLAERHGINTAHLRMNALENRLRGLVEESYPGRKKAGTTREKWAEKQLKKIERARSDATKFQQGNADAIEQGLASGLHLDSTGAASGLKYELAAEKYRQITQHLNDTSFWGKSDWTPADVQALGWSAIQRIHGVYPEDLMFAVERNTYDLAAQVLDRSVGMGQGLDYAAQKAVMQDIVGEYMPRIVEEENAFLRDVTFGPSASGDTATASASVRVVGAPRQIDRIVQRMEAIFDQVNARAIRRDVSVSKRKGAGVGKVALEVRSEAFDNPAKVQRFWERLLEIAPPKMRQHLQEYMPYEHQDMKGIRIVTQSNPVAQAKTTAWAEKNWGDLIKQAAEDAGLRGETKYSAVNVEVRDAKLARGEARAGRSGGAVPVRGGRVGDPLAAEARAALDEAISKHSGIAGAARRGLARLAQEEGTLRPGAFFPERPSISAEENVLSQLGAREAGTPPRPPEPPTPAPPPTPPPPPPGEQIMQSMGEATRLRREQEVLRSQERAARAEEVMQILEANPGEEGYARARAALRGELPTLTWGRHTAMTQDAIDDMVAHIRGHPSLQGRAYDTLNTEGAIYRIVNGGIPRRYEQKLLRQVFGPEVADQLKGSVPFWRKLAQGGISLLNLPRTIMSSFDLSAPFRQGLMFGISHPRLFFRNFRWMFKAAGSKNGYAQILQEIQARPTYDLMQRGKVAFTDLGTDLTKREEQYMSHFADHIPGVGLSQRAYVAFLNKSRADYFDWLVQRVQQLRPDLDLESAEGEKVLKSFGRLVNTATGRGSYGDTLNKAMPAASAIFFAPRLVKSRLDLLNPVYYASLDPIARKEAFKQAAGLATLVAGLGTMATYAGAKFEHDPRNANWGKIRFGDTRFDIAGGFQQPLRTLAQIASGTIISSTTGKKMQLAGGFGELSRKDILQRFIESKFSPPASFVNEMLKGTTFEGEPISLKKEIASRLIPLLMQDAYDMYHESGNIPAALAIYGIGMWGIGSQTYGAKPPKGRQKAGKGNILSGPSGGSILSGGGSGGGILSGGGGGGILAP